MDIREIMTPYPVCATPDTSLVDVAQMFVDFDCGAVPVVETLEGFRPVGIVTDRDITCRVVARGENPQLLKVRDCMTSPVEAVSIAAPIEKALTLMADRKLRRVVVIDDGGRCCGIVSQADIALHAPPRDAAEVVKEVSAS